MTEAKRIYIRLIQHTDASAIFAYRSLECVAQYQYWEPFTAQQSLDFAEQNSRADIRAKGVWIGLAIILKSGDKLIGDCALKIDGQKAEIGCNISPEHQRHGYAQDALNLLIGMCFEEFEVSEVFGITDSENLSSVKLMQSLGMNKIETFENKLLCKDRLSVEHKYYINKNHMKITDDLSLRPLQADDAKDIYDTIDAQREYLGRWLPFVTGTTSVAITQAFVDYSLSAEDKTFTIRKDNKFIGLIGFKATDKDNHKTEIGYWLSQDHQGKGIMTRAVGCLCKYAFEELEINRVQIKCAVGNTPSCSIPKRLGFKFEGVERAGELFADGKFMDIEIYSFLKNEYKDEKRNSICTAR